MKYIIAVSVIATKGGIIFIHSVFNRNGKIIVLDITYNEYDVDDVVLYIVAYSTEAEQISVYDSVAMNTTDINLTEAEELMLYM